VIRTPPMIPGPTGRFAVRQDLTAIDVRELAAPEGDGPASRGLFGRGSRKASAAPGERRYGLGYQVWETDAQTGEQRFVRRVVAAWLAVEEMPDSLQFHQEFAPEEASRVRRQMWDMIAAAMAVGGGNPEAGRPPLAAYPPGVQQDATLVRGVAENLEQLADRWCAFAAWQPDGEAFWVRTNGLHSCVGLDGSASPRLYLERKSRTRDSWLPVADHSQRFEGLPDRKAKVTFDDGTAILDGAPRPDLMHPYAVPLGEDGWVPSSAPAAAAIAATLPDHVVVVGVDEWTPHHVVAAIEDLTRELTPGLVSRAVDRQVVLRFEVAGVELSEDEFFGRVGREVPEAADAIRKLVEQAAAVLEDTFVYSDPEEGIGLLSQAVWALGVLDPAPWATLTAYGRVVDAEHESTFAGQTVPAVLAARGWDDEAIDFVFWVMVRNYFNTLTDLKVVWNGWGLRGAVVDRDPVELARRVVGRHRDDIASRRYELARRPGGLEQLAGDLPYPYEPWVEAFLREVSDQLAGS
jgi:hypothetical protein